MRKWPQFPFGLSPASASTSVRITLKALSLHRTDGCRRKGLLCIIMLKTGPQGLLAPGDKEILTHTQRCSVTLFLE